MTTQIEALDRFNAMIKKHENIMAEIEAPGKAIKLLFDVSEKDMIIAIREARQCGVDTRKIVLPPLKFDNTTEQVEAIKLLFGKDATDLTRITKDGLIMSFRGHPLVVGEKLESI